MLRCIVTPGNTELISEGKRSIVEECEVIATSGVFGGSFVALRVM